MNDGSAGLTPEMRAEHARWHAERNARKVTDEALEAWLSSDAAQAEDAVNRADLVRAHDPACDTLEFLWLPGRADTDQGAEKHDPVPVWRCTCCLLKYRRARRG